MRISWSILGRRELGLFFMRLPLVGVWSNKEKLECANSEQAGWGEQIIAWWLWIAMGECLGCRSRGSSINPRLLLPHQATRRALSVRITLSIILERTCSLAFDAHEEKLVVNIIKGKWVIKRDEGDRGRGRSSLDSKTGPKSKKGVKLC